MLLHRGLYSLCILLMTEVILPSRSHQDCDHDRVAERFFYLCSAYSPPYSSIKRETNAAEGSGYYQNSAAVPIIPGESGNNGPGMPQQQPQPGDPRLIDGSGMSPSGPGPQQAPPNIYPAWNVGSDQPSPNRVAAAGHPQDVQDHRGRRKVMQHPAAIPNEPEDFASFNNWYLNPVYADADWQVIERWRRNVHRSEEIWRFVRNKCCKTGCRFPEAYWELDQRVDICGVR